MKVWGYAWRRPLSGAEQLDEHYARLHAGDVATLKAYGVHELFVDEGWERRERDRLFDQLERGDVVAVVRLADLAGDVEDLLRALAVILGAYVAGVVMLADRSRLCAGLGTGDLVKLLGHIGSAARGYERDRTLRGNIDAAPRPRGRPNGSGPTKRLNPAALASAEAALRSGSRVPDVAAMVGVSESTLRRQLDVPGIRRSLP